MPQTKQITKSKTEQFVATGCLATGSRNGTIYTSPLGSCVAFIAYDKTSKNGGIAHTMLPGKSPTEEKAEENKYAENAIENLLDALKKSGSKKANIEICLVGKANVLKKEYKDMLEYVDSPANYVEIMNVLDEWPKKKKGDICWA